MPTVSPLARASVRALSPYVPGEQPRMRDLVKLNTNENPYPPTPSIRAALDALRVEDLRLYPDPAADALRARIAALHGASPGNVLVANGSDEALRLCIDAFCEPDGSVGYVEPSYSLYPVLADIRGLRRAPLDLWPDLAWRVPSGYAASVFFLTNPNAPTGHLFAKDGIRAFCEGFPGVVVIDEAYADFAGVSCADLALALPNVLVCRTLSKSYSLAGLRLGWLVGSAPLVAALDAIRDSYNIDRVAQAVACAALDDPAWMRANVERIRASRDRLAAALRDRGWTVADSATNFLWARPPAGGPDATALFRQLRGRAVVVRHWDAPRLRDFLRITVGTDAECDRLLAAL